MQDCDVKNKETRVKKPNCLRYGLQLGAVVSLLLVLSTCSHKDNLLTGKYKPQLNPHPKYFFTVQGYVAPELINHIKVGWRIMYIGANDKCDYVANSFEGINASRGITVYYHPKPDKSGRYQIKIPLDKYSSGYCHWQAFRVETNYGNGDKNGYGEITDFGPCGTSESCDRIGTQKISTYKIHGVAIYHCKFKKNGSLMCIWARNSVDLSDDFLVPKNRNYYYSEHYFYKR